MSLHILAIETSVPEASVALSSDGSCTEEAFTSQRQQNQLLFEPLQKLLTSLGSEKLDLILIGTGPGSYSGTRIAIAAAQGIATVHKCPIIGISSFFAIPAAKPNTTNVAIGDARRGHYFIHPVSEKDPFPKPTLIDQEKFIEEFSILKAQANHAFFTFESRSKLPITGIERKLPLAMNLINYWQSLDTQTQLLYQNSTLEPLYLSAPFITKSTKNHPLINS